MTFEEMWSKQPPFECKDDLLEDNIHLLKWCYEKGQEDIEHKHEWHYDGVPEITYKTCIALTHRLPNVILVFWDGEVWTDKRTLEKYKKVKAWKYVDFPKEIE